jgi:hypothetical protein
MSDARRTTDQSRVKTRDVATMTTTAAGSRRLIRRE